MRITLLVPALLAAFAIPAAHADTFAFSYTFSNGDVLSANLNGTLQADGNTFDVTGYNSVSYNGVAQNYTPNAFEAYSEYYSAGFTGNVDDSGVVTLDGSYENFIDYSTFTGNGYDLIVNAGYPQFNNGSDLAVAGFSNLSDQPFIPADFSATATTPEPSSLALLGTGALGLIGIARRRFLRA